MDYALREYTSAPGSQSWYLKNLEVVEKPPPRSMTAEQRIAEKQRQDELAKDMLCTMGAIFAICMIFVYLMTRKGRN